MLLRTTSPVPEMHKGCTPEEIRALYAWHEVANEADIELLERESLGFHDAVIVGMQMETGCFYAPGKGTWFPQEPADRRLSLIVDSEWYGRMELEFTGVRRFCCQQHSDNYFPEIYGADVTFRTDLLGKTRDERLIVWADHDIAPETAQIDLNDPPFCYVIAEALRWRLREQ